MDLSFEFLSRHAPRLVRISSLTLFAASLAIAPQEVAARAGPATYEGKATCGAKYEGSFLDIGRGECWTCPAGTDRTVMAVTSSKACVRQPRVQFKRAAGPRKPTGLLKTDCDRGWFLDIGKGKCYSCGGWVRTPAAVTSAKACTRAVGPAYMAATLKGKPGCPEGSFRHGLSENCYACPEGSVRNLNIGSDLTKIDACTYTDRGAAKARFERERNTDAASRQNGLEAGQKARKSAAAQPPNGDSTGPDLFTPIRREIMKNTLDKEAERGSDYDTITWLVTGGGSVIVGYTHGYGFAMTRTEDQDDHSYVCKKVEAHTFVGGATVGAGLDEAWSLSQGGLGGVPGESNGWAVGASAVFVGFSVGMQWAASPPHAKILTFAYVPAGLDLNGQYVHTWTKAFEGVVDCSSITWNGQAWENL